MERYIGTKILKALPMTRGDYNEQRGWPLPEGEDQDVAGYLVEYEDGYQSWSPATAFEPSYNLLTAMTFGHAIEMLKLGKKVARAGWNGKGQSIFLAVSGTYVDTDALRQPLRPFIAIQPVEGPVVLWLASQTDMLVIDWTVVD